MGIDKSTITRNLAWAYAERIVSQGISFILSLVLARLLLPSEYGIIGIVLIFINICEVFTNHGFNTALIQKKDVDSLDYNTNQILSFTASLVLYLVLFICAPYIAVFYREPVITDIIRVMGIRIIIGSVNAVQRASFERNFAFKKLFVTSLIGVSLSGAAGIVLAYKGFGVWSLVFQSTSNIAIYTIVLLLISGLRFKPEFSYKRAAEMLRYSWKLTLSSFINALYNDSSSLLVGKVFSPTVLAFYNRGVQIPVLIVNNINTSIDKVMFPALSTVQNDTGQVRQLTRRAIKTSSYILFPILIGLAACAEPFIHILLTDKWQDSIPYLEIFCVTYMFMPIHTANLQAIKAVGRSDVYLKLEIVKKIYGLLLMLVSIFVLKSAKALAWSTLLTSVISCFVNAYPNKKLIDYTYREQISDILPNITIAAIMGVSVWLVNFVPIGYLYKMLIEIPLGISLYFLLSLISKNESFHYLSPVIKGFIKRKDSINE